MVAPGRVHRDWKLSSFYRLDDDRRRGFLAGEQPKNLADEAVDPSFESQRWGDRSWVNFNLLYANEMMQLICRILFEAEVEAFIKVLIDSVERGALGVRATSA